ncbi:uncharacterized protein LTR77_010443 [Saxophila tyrrhenica]|uniref:NodB homology domain-containing protein n=1 Tax=Saxophila tyrrhenica TaxID=1690608 RepID=A0AAV9NX54_9PEZI|nr:hypothetical protein LTR77_010443 [Saxophila tyrrhenica]
MSYLGISGCHAFVTGGRGGIGSAIVEELLAAGCKVSAHDLKAGPKSSNDHLLHLQGDISDESSISSCIKQAVAHFGPVNILAANAGTGNESSHPSIWEIELDDWEHLYRVNVRGTFLTIKHFLLAAKQHQETQGSDLENLAIVVTGSECGKFGQAGHADYSSGKAGLQYGLVPTVKNEIVKLNSKARINAVAPGWVNTELIGDRLDDPRELYLEAQGTVALKKIAQPEDVARTVAFLASHRAAGHITGQCLSVDGGMEGRIMWREEEVLGSKGSTSTSQPSTIQQQSVAPSIPPQVSSSKPKRKLKIAWSFDFDAVSGWLGTGAHPNNSTADYSQGYFSAHQGVPRLLKMLRGLGIADKVTWCIPGHSIETFPDQTKAIVDSGAEIALHGYAHEAASQMTAEQERDVLTKCIGLIQNLTGKRPRGYRAPLYLLQERTIALLQEHDFLWDSSLTHYDSTPYFLPLNPAPIEPIDFTPEAIAESWMHPSPNFASLPKSKMVEVPCNWYMEDATPMQFYPNNPNTQGYVDVRVIERMWMDRVEWLRREMREEGEEGGLKVLPIVCHPDTSGMAHIIGMIERFLGWLQGLGEEVEFVTCAELAEEFRAMEGGR